MVKNIPETGAGRRFCSRYNPAIATLPRIPVTFIEKLSAAWTTNNSLLCVGLDPDLARLPSQFSQDAAGVLAFCKAIVALSATA